MTYTGTTAKVYLYQLTRLTINSRQSSLSQMGTKDTAGALALRRLRSDHGISQVSIAERLGAKQQTVSEWARGLCRPSHALRLKLEIAFGIPARAWLTPDEAREIACLERDGRVRSLPAALEAGL